MKEKNKEKIIYIEAIKVFATILIVCQHTISQEWASQMDAHTRVGFGLNLLFLLTRMAVPLFFMCNGAVMLAKERTIKQIFCRNIWRILKTYLIWMFIFGVVDLAYMQKPLSPTLIGKTLLGSVLFGRYHTWFLATLIGLYLITPFLYEIMKKELLSWYFVLLAFFVMVFLPVFRETEALSGFFDVYLDSNFYFVRGYVLFFVLGALFNRLPLKKRMLTISTVVFVGTTILAEILSVKKSSYMGSGAQKYYADDTILGILLSVSAFLLIRCLFTYVIHDSVRLRNILLTLGAQGMGIYLCHPLLIPYFSDFHGYTCLIAVGIIWLVAMGFCLLIKHIPLIKKLPFC